MFTSSRRSRGWGVRWVEPGRRRRRRLPVLPIAILVLLLAAGGAVAYVLHQRASDRAELHDTAVRFAAAWARGKPASMYRELDADARSKYSARRFAADYRTANAEATVQRVVTRPALKAVDGKVAVAVAVRTKLFGTLRGRVALPVTRVGERVGVRWRPYLRLPGLRPGERVERKIRARPRRASALAADGRRLDREPSAQAIAGSRAGRQETRASGSRRATTTASAAARAPSCASARAASPPRGHAGGARYARRSGPRSSALRSPRSATGSAGSRCCARATARCSR